MASRRFVSTLALLLAGWASPAAAGNDLKADFTATVINVLGDPGGAVVIGDAVDGSFVVDCEAEKLELTPVTQGIHPYAVSKFDMKFASQKVKYSESGKDVPSFEPWLVMYNNQDFIHNGGDEFGFFFDPVGDAIQGAEPTRVSFGLVDTTGTLYDTTDLPTSLDLADFDVAYVFVQYGGGWYEPGGVSVVTYLDTLNVKSQCEEVCIDADGDGWCADVDCDDTDPLINPDAAELECDGLDNDCNPYTIDDVDLIIGVDDDDDLVGNTCDPCPFNNPDDSDEDGVCG